MKPFNTRRRNLVLRDAALALLLSVLLKLLSRKVSLTPLLNKDMYALIFGIISGASVFAYKSFVDAGPPKVQRLKASLRFKNVLLVMFLYPVITIILYVVQAWLYHGGLLALSAAVVSLYRLIWFWIRTINMFRRPGGSEVLS